MFGIEEVEAVSREVEYAENKWGTAFDDKNTLNDWVAYITMYASDAARMDIMDDQDAQYRMMIKAAGLALNCAGRIRENQISGRHYDVDRSLNPQDNIHGEGMAASLQK